MESNKYCRALVGVLFGALALVPLAYSKGYSPAVTAQPGGYAVKFASNGTPLAVPVSNVAGGVGATTSSKLILPGGIDYPFVATSIIATGAMLTPWGSAISLAIAAGSIGVAVLDQALSAAKIRLKPNAPGILEIADSSVCSVSPCYGFSVTTQTNSPVFSSISSLAPWALENGPAFEKGHATYSLSSDQLYLIRYYDGAQVDRYIVQKSEIPPSPASYSNITLADAALTMSSRAPSQSEVQALVDLGFPPQLAVPVLTGVPSVFKGNIVQLGLDGTVTEIEERYIASFQPGIIGIGVEKKQTVTTPQKTATTTTTNADGTTSSAVTTTPRTSTTVSTIEASPAEKDDCLVNPLRIGCAYIDVPEGNIPKVNKDVSYIAETMFGAGACPADLAISQSLTGRPIALSYKPTCNALSTYVKPIVIAIALFMAYLIILPGGTKQ